MGAARPLVRRWGGVALEHVLARPTGYAHEAPLAAALGEPRVRERVAKLVRVDVADARLFGAASEHLRHPRGRHPSLAAEPQPVLVRPGMAAADAELAVEGV